MQLSRRFSPITLLLISINGMLGSAWLFAPLYAAKIAGVGSIISWLIGGFATVIIALTFAELSTLVPVAGGTAQIPEISHGTFTSFIFSWIAWLSALTMAPIEVQAVLQYASTYFGSLVYQSNGVPVLTLIGLFWATILMLFLSIVNIISFKGLVRFNFALFSFKTIVIILAITTLIGTSYHPENLSISNGLFTTDGWRNILAAVASAGVAFAFTGFKHGVELAGEAKDSKTAVPLAIIGSVVGCLILYMGLQIAFILALDPKTLAQGWSNLTFVGDVGPFAGLAASLGVLWLLYILYVDAAVSPLGAGLIYVTSTSRILYAMSKLNIFPQALTKLNKQNFPVIAIMVNFFIGMFLFLPLPGWQSMVEFLVSGMVLSYAMGPIALLCLRDELKTKPRTFRLPCANIVCVLAFYFCNLISYWTGWHTIWKLEVAILIGMVFFAVAYFRGKMDMLNLELKSALWVVPYLLGLGIISYFGSFGGTNAISFGQDFFVIFIFSIVILYMAYVCRSSVNVVQKFEGALAGVDG